MPVPVQGSGSPCNGPPAAGRGPTPGTWAGPPGWLGRWHLGGSNSKKNPTRLKHGEQNHNYQKSDTVKFVKIQNKQKNSRNNPPLRQLQLAHQALPVRADSREAGTAVILSGGCSHPELLSYSADGGSQEEKKRRRSWLRRNDRAKAPVAWFSTIQTFPWRTSSHSRSTGAWQTESTDAKIPPPPNSSLTVVEILRAVIPS